MEVNAAVAWPFAFGGEISERLEWATDVLDPPIGAPQTRKLNDAPRVTLAFDGLESGDHRRWLEHLLHVNGAGLWHVPLMLDRTAIDAAAAGGATSLSVATAHLRFVAGGNAILLGPDPRQHEVVEIESVSGSAVTLADPLASAWPAGTALFPSVGARLAQLPQLSRFTADDAPYAASFRVDEPMDWTADFGGAAYRGFPVLELQVDWSSDPTYTPERRLELVDSGLGRIQQFDLAGVARPSTRFDVTLESRAGLAAFRSLLYAMCGRWSPVWVPSLGRDLEIVAVNSPTTVDVAWSGLSDWPLQTNRRDVRFARAGAAPVYRRITNAASVSAGVERITLDSALPVGFAAADVTVVSFMALSLQDTDVNVLRVWSRDVVLSELTFRGFHHAY